MSFALVLWTIGASVIGKYIHTTGSVSLLVDVKSVPEDTISSVAFGLDGYYVLVKNQLPCILLFKFKFNRILVVF